MESDFSYSISIQIVSTPLLFHTATSNDSVTRVLTATSINPRKVVVEIVEAKKKTKMRNSHCCLGRGNVFRQLILESSIPEICFFNTTQRKERLDRKLFVRQVHV